MPRFQLDSTGLLWHGRHLLTMTLPAARWEAAPADEVLGVADVTWARSLSPTPASWAGDALWSMRRW
jgi:hypothetical protein